MLLAELVLIVTPLDLSVPAKNRSLLCSYRTVEFVIKTEFLKVQPNRLPNLQVTAANRLPPDSAVLALAPTMTNVLALHAPPIDFPLQVVRLNSVVRRLLVTFVTGTLILKKRQLFAQLHILEPECMLGSTRSGTLKSPKTLRLYRCARTPNSTAWSVPAMLAVRM